MEVNKIIAKNLKSLRTERNLSLGQLSTICGVSKVMLSQIEKGETNPTINTIWKIANGLKTPYTALLEEQKDNTLIIKKSEIIPQNGDNEHYRIYCYYQNTPYRNFEMFQIELDSNHSYTSIGHSEKSEEYVFVIEGQLTIKIDDKDYILNKNDSITFDASSKHTYLASSEKTVTAITINFYPA